MKRMSVMMSIMMNSGLWIHSLVILRVIGTKTMGENSCEVDMTSDFGYLTLSSGCQSYTVKIRTSTELAFEVEVKVEPFQPNCSIEIKNENDHSVLNHQTINITDFPIRETIRSKGLNLAFQCPKTVSQLTVAWRSSSTLRTGALSIYTNRSTTWRADVSERSRDSTDSLSKAKGGPTQTRNYVAAFIAENVVIPVVLSLLVVLVIIVIVVVIILRRRLKKKENELSARYRPGMDDIEVYDDNEDYNQLQRSREHTPTSSDNNSNIYGASPTPKDEYAVVVKTNRVEDLQPTEEYDDQKLRTEYNETEKAEPTNNIKNENVYE